MSELKSNEKYKWNIQERYEHLGTSTAAAKSSVASARFEYLHCMCDVRIMINGDARKEKVMQGNVNLGHKYILKNKVKQVPLSKLLFF